MVIVNLDNLPKDKFKREVFLIRAMNAFRIIKRYGEFEDCRKEIRDFIDEYLDVISIREFSEQLWAEVKRLES